MFPKNILRVRPENFDVLYAINVHMLNDKGELNKVDKAKAFKEWESINAIYESLGFKLFYLEDTSDLVDMVFCANTFLSFKKEGKPAAFLSNMHSDKRKAEVALTRKFLEEKNIEIFEIDSDLTFESTGDAIWDYENETLFAGHGFRTLKNAYTQIEKEIENIIYLKLVDERFYHLDTCFSVLNGETAVYVGSAFEKEDILKLKVHFKNLIEISEEEAIDNFAGNCHCPNGKDVIIQKGATKLNEELEKLGFNIHQVETGEFMKSGGSVFCMKNQFYL